MVLKTGIDPVHNRLDNFVNDPTVRLSVLKASHQAQLDQANAGLVTADNAFGRGST